MGTLRPVSAPLGKTHEGRCTTVSLSCLFLSVGSASPNHGYPCSMGETGQESVLYLEGEEMGPERARALLTATQPIATKSKFGISASGFSALHRFS